MSDKKVTKKQGKYHALTNLQKKIMLDAGFLPKEIKEFDNSLATSYESRHFQNMIRSRKRWTTAMITNNWKPKEVYQILRRYYHKKETRSPWDFFRLEYAAISQKPVLSGSKFANFLDIRKDVSRNFGRAYARIHVAKQSAYKDLKGIPKRRTQ